MKLIGGSRKHKWSKKCHAINDRAEGDCAWWDERTAENRGAHTGIRKRGLAKKQAGCVLLGVWGEEFDGCACKDFRPENERAG